jgi:hypothetical protein
MDYKCENCSRGPCISNYNAVLHNQCIRHNADWEKIQKESPASPISLDDLEFGQEIEIKSDVGRDWQTVKYAGKMLASGTHLVNDGVHDTFGIDGMQWRLPLKDRIRRGQIMIDPITAVVWTFISFTAEGCEVAGSIDSDSNIKTKVLKSWRLPKREELIGLGLDGLGWLSEG